MSEVTQLKSGVIDDGFSHVYNTLSDLGYEVNSQHVNAILQLSDNDPYASLNRLAKAYAKANQLPKRPNVPKPL